MNAPLGNPFENVEPHCHLPAETKAALWDASQWIMNSPNDFAEGLEWLNENYSEAAILDRLLRDSERIHKSQLFRLWQGRNRCDTFPRRRALRAARHEIAAPRRLKLLQEFYSVEELAHIPREFILNLSNHPEKVRTWVVELTAGAARSCGQRVEDGQVVKRSYAAVGERGVPDEQTVEVYWRWLDEQSRQTIRDFKDDRQKRDAQRREQAKDRAWRLREAVGDAMNAGLPAGRDELIHARRAALLACLVAYQHELKLASEFGGWQWESIGSVFTAFVGGQYVPGRETVMFNPVHAPGEPLGQGSVNIDVERFTALVRRAVGIHSAGGNIRQNAVADPIVRAPKAQVDSAPATAGQSPKPAEHVTSPSGGKPQNTASGKAMTWQEAMKVAEAHCARNPFPGMNALAKIVRQTTGRTCSKSTILKAIDHSLQLRAKRAEHERQQKSVSARAMPEGTLQSAKQTRERDPGEAASTDEIFRALIQQSKEADRATLNAMDDAQRRKLVEAMDENSVRALFNPRSQ